jgi:hypothetical protein
MVSAQIGLLTGTAEALATAIGAGMLLGSFVLGSLGLLYGQARQDLERRVLTDGYYGGIFGTLLTVADLASRYG